MKPLPRRSVHPCPWPVGQVLCEGSLPFTHRRGGTDPEVWAILCSRVTKAKAFLVANSKAPHQRRLQRAYLVFWVAEDDGAVRYALKMAPTGQPASVMVTFGPRRRGDPATHDPASRAATRYGYGALLPLLVVPEAVPILVPPDPVRDEAGLRPRSALPGLRTLYRSAFSRLFGTRLRYPWDPQAVSDPWLVEEEFPGPRPPTDADRAQAQAAHEPGPRPRGRSPWSSRRHRGASNPPPCLPFREVSSLHQVG